MKLDSLKSKLKVEHLNNRPCEMTEIFSPKNETRFIEIKTESGAFKQ